MPSTSRCAVLRAPLDSLRCVRYTQVGSAAMEGAVMQATWRSSCQLSYSGAGASYW